MPAQELHIPTRLFFVTASAAALFLAAILALPTSTIAASSGKITKAPAPAKKSNVKVETVARGLENPWAVQELPDGRLIVSERPGRMRIIDKNGKLSRPLTGVPPVVARGQGGLLDLVLAPDFPVSKTIYFSYSEPRGRGRNGTSVAKARLNADANPPGLSDLKVIFRQKPDYRSTLHFGSRIVLAPDGNLFVTLGERYSGMKQAQNPGNHLGKVVRITNDGRPADGNPNLAGWAPEVWSIGHRNAQGAAINPRTGALWTVEHGARGGDEINIPAAGKNYGWPVITYGRDYSGAKIGIGTRKTGMEQPIYYWDPSIAPSGMTFYTSPRFPKWQNSVFIGALAGSHLTRLVLDGDTVIAEEKLLENLDVRIRDVRQAKDGSLLVITDENSDRVLRITPKS